MDYSISRRDLLKTAPVLAAGTSAITAWGSTTPQVKPPINLADYPGEPVTVDEKILLDAIEPIREYWGSTGLLADMERDDAITVLASALHNQRVFNETKIVEPNRPAEPAIWPIVPLYGDMKCDTLNRISVPITRRVWARIAKSNWIPLYPTLSPQSFVTYWRLRYPDVTLVPGKPNLVKESQEVSMGLHPTGFKYPWKGSELHEQLYHDGKGLDREADKAADMAKVIARYIETDSFVNMHRNAATVCTTTIDEFFASAGGLSRIMGTIPRKTFQGQRAGKFFLVVPDSYIYNDILPLNLSGRKGIDLRWADLSEDWSYLSLGGDAYYERRPENTIPALVVWKGDRMTDNGYFVLPYVTVAHKDGEIVTRYGRCMTAVGGNFCAAVNFKV